MKTTLQILIVLISVIVFCGGCAKEGCTDPTATNYNSKATKSDGSCRFVCNATDYTGSGSCGSGYVVVGGGYCCPASKPYTCASATSCYATCEDAKAAGCTTVEKGISQTGGGGGSAGYVCSGGSCTYVSSGASYTSLSSCQSNCSSGGSSGYKCSGGTCSYVSSGATYTSLSSCQSNCSSSSAGYVCSGGSCSYVSSGASYASLSSCQSNCGSSSAGYVCSSGTCSYVSSGATYTSLTSCQSSCGGSSAGYVCSGGSCSYVSSGASYTSLSSCQSSCGGGSSQVVFYTTKSTYGQINIFVNNSQRGTITQYYSATPSCGASGCVTVTITNQNNTWYAENTAGTYTWTGSFQLSSGCNTVQLN